MRILIILLQSHLSVASLNQACTTSDSTSAEARKHKANDPKCSMGIGGKEVRDIYFRLATRFDIGSPKSKSSFVYEIYSRLNLTLTRSVVRAIMAWTPIA